MNFAALEVVPVTADRLIPLREGLRVRFYRDASIFSANHLSTSERNHPPEACRCGKAPFLTHRKMVERFTPTTRRTSVVVIL
jgi:hypothetical protein